MDKVPTNSKDDALDQHCRSPASIRRTPGAPRPGRTRARSRCRITRCLRSLMSPSASTLRGFATEVSVQRRPRGKARVCSRPRPQTWQGVPRPSCAETRRPFPAARCAEVPSHPLSSRQQTRVFGVPLGVPKADFRPRLPDTKKPEARRPRGFQPNEPGGSRTHDLRIKRTRRAAHQRSWPLDYRM